MCFTFRDTYKYLNLSHPTFTLVSFTPCVYVCVCFPFIKSPPLIVRSKIFILRKYFKNLIAFRLNQIELKHFVWIKFGPLRFFFLIFVRKKKKKPKNKKTMT